MADIVLINPKFEVSYWGMEYALPYVGKRANLPVAALPLLAALTPEGHTITLIDENVEPIDFDRRVEFIQRARIPFAVVGLLHAIPKTPLYERMQDEGRLDPADRPEFVTNIRSLKMSPEELRDGYLRVLTELSDPENYFARTEALFLRPDFEIGHVKARPVSWRRKQVRFAWTQAKMVLPAVGLFLRLMGRIQPASLRREYRKRLWRFLKVHRRPGLTLFYLFHLVMYYHVYTIARTMAAGESRLVNTF